LTSVRGGKTFPLVGNPAVGETRRKKKEGVEAGTRMFGKAACGEKGTFAGRPMKGAFVKSRVA